MLHSPSARRKTKSALDGGSPMPTQTLNEPERGSAMRVYVRIRPFSAGELQESHGADQSTIQLGPEEGKLTILDPSKAFAPRTTYAFEYCFDSSVAGSDGDQGAIYTRVGRPILSNIVDGYNGCIFAYGQTGSGKTHTMLGPSPRDRSKNVMDKSVTNINSVGIDLTSGGCLTQSTVDPRVQLGVGSDAYDVGEMCGIIPRLSRDIFIELQRKSKENNTHSFRVDAEYFEIYNEKVIDLLTDGANSKDLRVRNFSSGPCVEGLKRCEVKSVADLIRLIHRGALERHTSSTKLNLQSSRSHAILSIHVLQMTLAEDDNSVRVTSKLNLVDLAGSERTGASGVEGRQFLEATKINLSLTTLGRVIDALADISSGKSGIFCPYRDSNLTWLLMDSLGGNSKTSMVATVSPHSVNFEEMSQTLRYASRAKQIVNNPVVNEDPQIRQIKMLTMEVSRLQKLLLEKQDDSGLCTADTKALQDRVRALEQELVDRDFTIRDLRDRLVAAQRKSVDQGNAAKLRVLEEENASLRESLENFKQAKKTVSQLQNEAKESDTVIKSLKKQMVTMEKDHNEYLRTSLLTIPSHDMSGVKSEVQQSQIRLGAKVMRDLKFLGLSVDHKDYAELFADVTRTAVDCRSQMEDTQRINFLMIDSHSRALRENIERLERKEWSTLSAESEKIIATQYKMISKHEKALESLRQLEEQRILSLKSEEKKLRSIIDERNSDIKQKTREIDHLKALLLHKENKTGKQTTPKKAVIAQNRVGSPQFTPNCDTFKKNVVTPEKSIRDDKNENEKSSAKKNEISHSTPKSTTDCPSKNTTDEEQLGTSKALFSDNQHNNSDIHEEQKEIPHMNTITSQINGKRAKATTVSKSEQPNIADGTREAKNDQNYLQTQLYDADQLNEHLKAKLTTAEELNEQLRTDLSSAHDAHTSEKQTLEAKLTTAEELNEQLRAEMSSAHEAHTSEKETLEARLTTAEELKEQLRTDLSSAHEAHTSEKETLEARLTTAEELNEQLRTDLSSAHDAHASEKQTLEAKLTTAEDLNEQLRAELFSANEENRKAVGLLNEKLWRLNNEVEQMEVYLGRVMTWKRGEDDALECLLGKVACWGELFWIMLGGAVHRLTGERDIIDEKHSLLNGYLNTKCMAFIEMWNCAEMERVRVSKMLADYTNFLLRVEYLFSVQSDMCSLHVEKLSVVVDDNVYAIRASNYREMLNRCVEEERNIRSTIVGLHQDMTAIVVSCDNCERSLRSDHKCLADRTKREADVARSVIKQQFSDFSQQREQYQVLMHDLMLKTHQEFANQCVSDHSVLITLILRQWSESMISSKKLYMKQATHQEHLLVQCIASEEGFRMMFVNYEDENWCLLKAMLYNMKKDAMFAETTLSRLSDATNDVVGWEGSQTHKYFPVVCTNSIALGVESLSRIEQYKHCLFEEFVIYMEGCYSAQRVLLVGLATDFQKREYQEIIAEVENRFNNELLILHKGKEEMQSTINHLREDLDFQVSMDTLENQAHQQQSQQGSPSQDAKLEGTQKNLSRIMRQPNISGIISSLWTRKSTGKPSDPIMRSGVDDHTGESSTVFALPMDTQSAVYDSRFVPQAPLQSSSVNEKGYAPSIKKWREEKEKVFQKKDHDPSVSKFYND